MAAIHLSQHSSLPLLRHLTLARKKSFGGGGGGGWGLKNGSARKKNPLLHHSLGMARFRKTHNDTTRKHLGNAPNNGGQIGPRNVQVGLEAGSSYSRRGPRTQK